jgi:hypothetical protein
MASAQKAFFAFIVTWIAEGHLISFEEHICPKLFSDAHAGRQRLRVV